LSFKMNGMSFIRITNSFTSKIVMHFDMIFYNSFLLKLDKRLILCCWSVLYHLFCNCNTNVHFYLMLVVASIGQY
jgi:hypothetical protein